MCIQSEYRRPVVSPGYTLQATPAQRRSREEIFRGHTMIGRRAMLRRTKRTAYRKSGLIRANLTHTRRSYPRYLQASEAKVNGRKSRKDFPCQQTTAQQEVPYLLQIDIHPCTDIPCPSPEQFPLAEFRLAHRCLPRSPSSCIVTG